jgi:hypothetical protein
VIDDVEVGSTAVIAVNVATLPGMGSRALVGTVDRESRAAGETSFPIRSPPPKNRRSIPQPSSTPGFRYQPKVNPIVITLVQENEDGVAFVNLLQGGTTGLEALPH